MAKRIPSGIGPVTFAIRNKREVTDGSQAIGFDRYGVPSKAHRGIASFFGAEKMRSRAFEKMIEIAEEEEGISILKKDGAKQ